MRSSVVLPAPLAPKTASVSPAAQRERHVAQRDALAVRAPDASQLDRCMGDESARSVCTTCGSIGAITGKSWSTAFGDAGEVDDQRLPGDPGTPRVRMPIGVC